MDPPGDRVKRADSNGIPSNYDDLNMSEWGLDWADLSQIRDKLELTPTERLKSAQEFMNTVIRIRAQNADRA